MAGLSRRVLLVEDNENDYLIIRNLLLDVPTARFDLEWVDNYLAASELLSRHQYDVCLVDYRLGEATGVDIVREFREGRTPFILLTGNEDYDVDVMAAKAGAADYLVKDHINASLLDRSIRYSIEHKDTEIALRQAQHSAQAAADRLKVTEERYRRLFEAAKDGILILDAASGRIDDVNPYLCQLLGFESQDFIGRQLWEIGAFQAIAANLNVFHALQNQEYFHYSDLSLTTPTGQSIASEISINLYESGEKKVVQCNIRDITKRKLAEEERDRFFNVSLDMLSIAGFDGYFKRLNPAFMETLGYSEAELMKKPSIELVHPEDQAATLAARHKLSTGEAVIGLENRYRSKDGSWHWLEWRSIATEKGEIYAAARDITQRKKVEAALQKANDELELRVIERTAELAAANEALRIENIERQMAIAVLRQAMDALQQAKDEADKARSEADEARNEADKANLAKSEFLSRMSHELRTPLNAILGFGQILEMEDLTTNGREGVAHILKGGHHLLGLINEILDIARIEAGHIELSLEPVDVTMTVREVLALVRPLASQREIQLINQVPEQKDWHVLADGQRLQQVLINLLSNAIKYNREAGRVVVTCTPVETPKEPTLRLGITDSGHGLSAEEVAKLFTPFERLGAIHTRIEGSGIGLVLSKRLIEAMQGAIGVESAVGQGSTFWIELPIVEARHNQLITSNVSDDSTSKQESPSRIRPRLTLLYIEDNLSNLRVVEMLLKRTPIANLLTAMQGSVGLDIARQHHPDVILLDLHLPDIMGDEVLRRLKTDEATRSIPVVMLSADATPNQIKRLLAIGAEEYLTKPLDVKQFFHVLEEILGDGDD